MLAIGETVPVPAPYAVTSMLTRVEVTNDSSGSDGFQMTFAIGRDSAADYSLLSGGALDPFNRVVISVLMGGAPEVLIDGVITHHQVAPSDEPGRSTLSVTGRDVSAMLDLEEKNEQYPNLPDSLIVTQVVAQHAQYGLVPLATPTTDVPIMTQQIPRQHETDLRFIKRLADRNGFVFYVEPIAFGVNSAYWGPETRTGQMQPSLTLGMGSASTVRSLRFSLDALAPVSTQGSTVEPSSGSILPIPSLPSLRVPALVAFPTQARRTVLMRDTANESSTRAATSALAESTRSPDPVTGEGELDGARYGAVLRARRLVGVRGVGFSYDGSYYVQRVTHVLARGDYTQRFSLSREGLGVLTPTVTT